MARSIVQGIASNQAVGRILPGVQAERDAHEKAVKAEQERLNNALQMAAGLREKEGGKAAEVESLNDEVGKEDVPRSLRLGDNLVERYRNLRSAIEGE
jgi:hypothetical protein